MRVSVIVPSRGRVRGLSAVLYGMHFLESGKHQVTYGVVCDNDDQPTIDFCNSEKERIPLAYKVGERHTSMGDMVNSMAELMPADVYLVINDDVLCLSNDWDNVIAQAIEKTPHGIFWWASECPQQVLFPIVSEKWRAAAGGVFSDLFPFWYDDLCLIELWTMVTDAESIILPIRICDKPKTVTHRMRELTFWQKVYNGTRKLRVEKAYLIAEKLGLPKPECPVHLGKLLDSHIRRVPDEWIKLIEHNQGDKSPPDASYLRKRAEAEKMLNELGENKEIPIAA